MKNKVEKEEILNKLNSFEVTISKYDDKDNNDINDNDYNIDDIESYYKMRNLSKINKKKKDKTIKIMLFIIIVLLLIIIVCIIFLIKLYFFPNNEKKEKKCCDYCFNCNDGQCLNCNENYSLYENNCYEINNTFFAIYLSDEDGEFNLINEKFKDNMNIKILGSNNYTKMYKYTFEKNKTLAIYGNINFQNLSYESMFENVNKLTVLFIINCC